MSFLQSIKLPSYNNNHDNIRLRLRFAAKKYDLVVVTSEVMLGGKRNIVGVVRCSELRSDEILPGPQASKYGNGAVFVIEEGSSTPRLVCIPSKKCFDVRSDEISSKPHQINGILDGSLLNLYWFDDKWMMGSKKTYNISDKHWRGLTYGEALSEALKMHSDFNYASLDQSKTYTILLCHSEMCPTNFETQVLMVSSQHLDLDTGVIRYCNTDSIGLPLYRDYKDCKYGEIIVYPGGYNFIKRTQDYVEIKQYLYNNPDNMSLDDFSDLDYILLYWVVRGKADRLRHLIPSIQVRLDAICQIYDSVLDEVLAILRGQQDQARVFSLHLANEIRKCIRSTIKIGPKLRGKIALYVETKNYTDDIYRICLKELPK